jgi:hypothetical protein
LLIKSPGPKTTLQKYEFSIGPPCLSFHCSTGRSAQPRAGAGFWTDQATNADLNPEIGGREKGILLAANREFDSKRASFARSKKKAADPMTGSP